MGLFMWFEPNLRMMLPTERSFTDFDSFGKVVRSFCLVNGHKIVLQVHENHDFEVYLYSPASREVLDTYMAPMENHTSLQLWLNHVIWLTIGEFAQ